MQRSAPLSILLVAHVICGPAYQDRSSEDTTQQHSGYCIVAWTQRHVDATPFRFTLLYFTPAHRHTHALQQTSTLPHMHAATRPPFHTCISRPDPAPHALHLLQVQQLLPQVGPGQADVGPNDHHKVASHFCRCELCRHGDASVVESIVVLMKVQGKGEALPSGVAQAPVVVPGDGGGGRYTVGHWQRRPPAWGVGRGGGGAAGSLDSCC